MTPTGKEYEKMVQKASPNSPIVKDTLLAFLVGGLICTLGQVLDTLYTSTGMGEENVKAAVPITLILLSTILTAFGIYDKIAGFAGAGTIVPITGFANSVVSPAMEFKSEGQVLGTSAKMFSIAGPVIVFGVGTAFLSGLVIWIFKLY